MSKLTPEQVRKERSNIQAEYNVLELAAGRNLSEVRFMKMTDLYSKCPHDYRVTGRSKYLECVHCGHETAHPQ